jgi:hypothetical protein
MRSQAHCLHSYRTSIIVHFLLFPLTLTGSLSVFNQTDGLMMILNGSLLVGIMEVPPDDPRCSSNIPDSIDENLFQVGSLLPAMYHIEATLSQPSTNSTLLCVTIFDSVGDGLSNHYECGVLVVGKIVNCPVIMIWFPNYHRSTSQMQICVSISNHIPYQTLHSRLKEKFPIPTIHLKQFSSSWI